jgi:hypothetical protein
VGQHISALHRHVGHHLFPYVLANNNPIQSQELPHLQPVRMDYPPDAGYRVIEDDLVHTSTPWRHDSDKLANQIMRLYHELQRQSLVNPSHPAASQQPIDPKAVPVDIL